MSPPRPYLSDFAVMMHPSRREWVHGYLEERLPLLTPFAEDRGLGEWDTAARALSAPGRVHDADWRVIVQDDALLAEGFAEAVEQALSVVEPRQPVSFYTGNVPEHAKVGGGAHACVDFATRAGAVWCEMPGPWWGVAFAVPSSDVAEILAVPSRSNETDGRIAAFYRRREVECLYSVPSIADHRRAAENPSMNGSPRDRYALNFIGERSALEIDWQGAETFRMHTRFRSLRNGRTKIVRPLDLAAHDESAVWQRL